MKKKLSFVSLVLCVALSLGIISACAQKLAADVTLLESSQSILVIRAEETKADVSLGDVLDDLKAAGKIDYTASYSEYGAYIQSINGREADGDSGEYWAVYTNLADYEGVAYSSMDYGSYEYGGTACGFANYGVDGLPIVEGMLYILVLST